jgi:enamine deaminase RidA (YjgF/YER057c/UK114 family)
MHPEERLRELGLEVAPLVPAAGNYVGAVQIDNTLFVAGHGPFRNGKPAFVGKLGRDLSIEEGKQAAELVALNMLGTIKDVLGDLDRVARVVKLLVMVNSMPDFGEQPTVANGASDLFCSVFGDERGKHARSAVGFVNLPFGIAVEIEGVFEVAR